MHREVLLLPSPDNLFQSVYLFLLLLSKGTFLSFILSNTDKQLVKMKFHGEVSPGRCLFHHRLDTCFTLHR